VTHSDASRFVSHVLRPSPEGTDIPRLTVFYCLLLRTPATRKRVPRLRTVFPLSSALSFRQNCR
jgi:hypothetical protein